MHVCMIAFITERCNCGDKNCNGFAGYLIMEYLPIGMYSIVNAIILSCVPCVQEMSGKFQMI